MKPNTSKSEFNYYKLLIKKVWEQVKSDIPVPNALSQNDAVNIAELIKEKTGRDINEKTLRNAFRKMVEEDAKLPSPYTLETLSQFVFGLNNPQAKASPSWLKFTANGRDQSNGVDEDSPMVALAHKTIEVKKKGKNSIKILLFLLLAIPIIGLIINALNLNRKPTDFTEEFNNSDLNYLKGNGWKVLFPNYEWLERQPSIDSGIFTLWTLPGDNWIKPGEQRMIPNLLVHKLEKDKDFEVELKVHHFFPNQGGSQQVSVFLLDENYNLKTCLRQNMLLIYHPTTSNKIILVEMLRFMSGNPLHSGGNYFEILKPGFFGEFKKMTLKLSVENKTVNSFAKPLADWGMWHHSDDNAKLSFTPAYVGIAAFQGWTLDDGTPMNADTIPVKLDYLKIRYH